MKERHWISLVTSIRHGESVLVLGPEIPAGVASGAPADASDQSFGEALTAKLASELEDDNRRQADIENGRDRGDAEAEGDGHADQHEEGEGTEKDEIRH